jgi:hypothetical protein
MFLGGKSLAAPTGGCICGASTMSAQRSWSRFQQFFKISGRASAVFATIRRYEGVGSIDVIALAAKEQFFPLFEKLPGFVSHTVVDTGKTPSCR